MQIDELNDFADIGMFKFNSKSNNRFVINSDTPRFNSRSWHIFELDPCDGQGRVCLVFSPVCIHSENKMEIVSRLMEVFLSCRIKM